MIVPWVVLFLFVWRENGHIDVQILDFCFLDRSYCSFGEEMGVLMFKSRVFHCRRDGVMGTTFPLSLAKKLALQVSVAKFV